MTASVEGKVAVVTGAGSGLGAASAAELSSRGAKVVVVDIDGAAAERTAAGLTGPAVAVAADISTDEGATRYLEAAVSAYGRVDLHHLNAGIVGSFAPLPETSTADFEKVIGVNLVGTFIGLREAFRQFARQDSGGAIVVTGSISGLRSSHDIIAYQASKHGVHGLVGAAAMYGGPLGIRVNGVAPGLVPTGLFRANSGDSGGGDDMLQRGTTVPMRRTGEPAEVAAAVAFLLSDDATYITGEVLSVDGGSAQVSTVRPAGGAGAWDPSALDAGIRETARRERDR
ncbi:SDR family oxidoreductase [Okibacterium endophyticum]